MAERGEKKGSNKVLNAEKLLEKILSPENMDEAIKQVKGNKGAAGVDGMLTTELETLKPMAKKLRS